MFLVIYRFQKLMVELKEIMNIWMKSRILFLTLMVISQKDVNEKLSVSMISAWKYHNGI